MKVVKTASVESTDVEWLEKAGISPTKVFEKGLECIRGNHTDKLILLLQERDELKDKIGKMSLLLEKQKS